MQFDALCNLILESQVLSKEFLKNYDSYLLRKCRNKAVTDEMLKDIYKNIKAFKIPSGGAIIARYRGHNVYVVLLNTSLNRQTSFRFYQYLQRYLSADDTDYAIRDHDRDGDLVRWEPIESYNIDDETKDTWKGVIDEL